MKKKIKNKSFYSPFDPQGSYTGYANNSEKPCQDADDL